jgi:hypothetical protein
MSSQRKKLIVGLLSLIGLFAIVLFQLVAVPAVDSSKYIVLEYSTIGENYISFTIKGVIPDSILELEGKEHKAAADGTIALDGPRDRFFKMETFKINGIIYSRTSESESFTDEYNHEVYRTWLVPSTTVP